MANKPQVCEPCAKLCEEAKQNVKKLQKKVYVLTIVCTAAITLLGEQGAKALIAVLDTTKTAISSVESPEKTKIKENNSNIENEEQPLNFDKKISKNNIKPYELVDELSISSEHNKKENKKNINFIQKIETSYVNNEENTFFPKIKSLSDDSISNPKVLPNVAIPNNFTYNFLPLNAYNLGLYTPTDDLDMFSQPVLIPEPASFIALSCFFIAKNKRKYRQ